ncbi:unnamed protein product [Mytilus edulis]|uniref:COR domain-containing protein n=1 Tax=Mytilus edulis TaxID=6550 RepID=A0A8S3TXD3_MYTED|nr:unnamed protein product [Mytilus edulis]
MDMNDWGIDCPLKWLLFQQVLGTLKTNNIHISTTKTLLEIAKHEDIGINQDEEVKRCLQYCHNIGTIIYFNEEHLQRYVILDPKWLVNAFRCLVSDKIEDMVRVSDDWQTLRETGELTDLLISRLFQKEPTLGFFENKRHLIEVMKRFDIIVSLRNSVALYMPCMMKSYSFEEFGKQFVDGKKYYFRTSWLCLEFEFLPPAFFNHILAWYIKQYDVSIIFDRGTRKERKALYRQIGVFNLDSSGCEQLVICEGPNIIALQVWNSQRSDQTYGYLKSSLVHFVVELGDHYKLRIKFTITFKCNEGDFTIHRKKMKDLLFKYYHCQEHETDHSSGDLVIPWEMNEELE